MKKLLLGLSAFSVAIFAPLSPMSKISRSGAGASLTSTASTPANVSEAVRQVTEAEKALREALARKEPKVTVDEIARLKQAVKTARKNKVTQERKARNEDEAKSGVVNTESELAFRRMMEARQDEELEKDVVIESHSDEGIIDALGRNAGSFTDKLGQWFATAGRDIVADNLEKTATYWGGRALIAGAKWLDPSFKETMADEITVPKEFTDNLRSLRALFGAANSGLKKDKVSLLTSEKDLKAAIDAFIAAIDKNNAQIVEGEALMQTARALEADSISAEAGSDEATTKLALADKKKKEAVALRNQGSFEFLQVFGDEFAPVIERYRDSLDPRAEAYLDAANKDYYGEIQVQMAAKMAGRVVTVAGDASDKLCDFLTRKGITVNKTAKTLTRLFAESVGESTILGLPRQIGGRIARGTADTLASLASGEGLPSFGLGEAVFPASRAGGAASSSGVRATASPGDLRAMYTAAVRDGYLHCKFGASLYKIHINNDRSAARLVSQKLAKEYSILGDSCIFNYSEPSLGGVIVLRWASGDPVFEDSIKQCKVK